MTASHVYNITERLAACQRRLREQPCIYPWQKANFQLFRHPIGVENLKLGMYNTPVLPPSGPLFCYVHGNQIKHLEKTIICWKYGLGFGYFPKLAIESFNCIRIW
jgi:hypothetical protein